MLKSDFHKISSLTPVHRFLYNDSIGLGYLRAVLEASRNKVAFPNLEVLEIGKREFNDSLRFHTPNLKSLRLDDPQGVHSLPPSLEHLALLRGSVR